MNIVLALQKHHESEVTPLKVNMEPKNHLFETENHLPNHHFQVSCQSSRVYFAKMWCSLFDSCKFSKKFPQVMGHGGPTLLGITGFLVSRIGPTGATEAGTSRWCCWYSGLFCVFFFLAHFWLIVFVSTWCTKIWDPKSKRHFVAGLIPIVYSDSLNFVPSFVAICVSRCTWSCFFSDV